MKKHVIAALALSLSLIPCVVMAAQESQVRDKLYGDDKQAALEHFGAKQQKQCLAALDDRYPSGYTLKDALHFNNAVSDQVYDRLYWKGAGNLRRGLAFTAPVADIKEQPATLVCYYSLTDHALDFQDAYVIRALPAEMANAGK